MDSKEYKKLFDEVAKTNNFEKAFGGWFKESVETILVLELQKSNFSNRYDLNIKIYIQGMLGNIYTKNKDMVNKDTGDVFRREPKEYEDASNLDMSLTDIERRQCLENLFIEFINPFSILAASKDGIKDLAEKGVVYLLPAVKERL